MIKGLLTRGHSGILLLLTIGCTYGLIWRDRKEQLMYCEDCKTLFEGTKCPNCIGKRLREVTDKDDCFLIEKEMLWGEMLADLLRQHDIPFYYKSVLGAGIASSIGAYLDRYRFYVPHPHLAAAQEIVDEVFSNVDVE